MNNRETLSTGNIIYYRIIAVWVLCEAMLGGIIHGLKIPASGLIVGSSAVICISLIAWYVPERGAIIKATIIVAIFKMMLSPQAPLPAYIAVFFQGLMGELLFRNKKFFRLSCILLAVLSLLESGLQRILMLTIIYGNGLWKAVNDFINGLTQQNISTNYSLLIGIVYVLLHLITGFFVGWWASLLPGRIVRWHRDKQYSIHSIESTADVLPEISMRKKSFKIVLFVFWIFLVGLYLQSYFNIGKPILPSHISLKILLRSLIIILTWIFIIGPVLTQLLHRWLKNKQSKWQQDVQEVLLLLPGMQKLMAQSWKQSSGKKGLKKVNTWSKMVLVNALSTSLKNLTVSAMGKVYILSAPIQTGKTTSLINWVHEKNNVYGILTPVVNGKRVFMDAYSKETFPMEATNEETDSLKVGRYIFSKSGFEKAIQIINAAMDKEGWLVIDEIGLLELQDEGFYSILKEVLVKRQHKVLLVVRDKGHVLENVKDKYGINDAIILNKHPDFGDL